MDDPPPVLYRYTGASFSDPYGHQFHHGVLGYIVHPQMAREAVSKIVKRKMLDAGTLDVIIEGFPPVPTLFEIAWRTLPDYRMFEF